MKNICKALSILFFTFALIVVGANTSLAASPWDQTNVDPYKDWVIKFNTEVDETTLYPNIYVVDEFSHGVQGVQILLNDDNLSVTVKAPPGGYQADHTYFLYVEQGVKALNGKVLKNRVEMKFVIKPTGSSYTSKFGHIADLKLGMTKDEVKRLRGGEPEHSSSRENLDIWMYDLSGRRTILNFENNKLVQISFDFNSYQTGDYEEIYNKLKAEMVNLLGEEPEDEYLEDFGDHLTLTGEWKEITLLVSYHGHNDTQSKIIISSY